MKLDSSLAKNTASPAMSSGMPGLPRSWSAAAQSWPVLAFRRSATAGAEMEPADLVRYTRDQIALARQARTQSDRRDPAAVTPTQQPTAPPPQPSR